MIIVDTTMSATGRRAMALLFVLLLATTALAVLPGSAVLATPPFSIIDNGTVQLGVHAEGHFNVPGGVPSSGTGTTVVGLRFLPTGAESTSPGCLCEGWGVWDSISGVSGYANESAGSAGLVAAAPVSSPSTVITTADAGTTFRVTHDYHPSVTPLLYEATVTIENISAATVNAVYRRVMDWDIEPTAFSEFVTIQGTPSALIFSSDNGFASSNPAIPAGTLLFSGEAIDSGPADHGAVFDFDFGNLDPGEAVTFNTYYGAAGTEANAIAALTAVSAELFSLGQPNVAGGPDLGTPNTFIFAFTGVGGPPILGLAIDLDPDFAVNELGVQPDHTVTATVHEDGSPLEGAVVDFTVSGPSGPLGPVAVLTDANGQASYTYPGVALGLDTITACVEVDICDVVEKEWVDTTPPVAQCVEGPNPSGNVPRAPGNGGQGQNQDGFYTILANDLVDPDPAVFVVDTGTGFVFGPFASGTNIKYTEANGADPSQAPGPGVVDWNLKGQGDAAVFAVDASGNVSDHASCLVPPAPQ